MFVTFHAVAKRVSHAQITFYFADTLYKEETVANTATLSLSLETF